MCLGKWSDMSRKSEVNMWKHPTYINTIYRGAFLWEPKCLSCTCFRDLDEGPDGPRSCSERIHRPASTVLSIHTATGLHCDVLRRQPNLGQRLSFRIITKNEDWLSCFLAALFLPLPSNILLGCFASSSIWWGFVGPTVGAFNPTQLFGKEEDIIG